MTFFSIIIPTYNRAYLISDAIWSVISQTYGAFEIIIVDDGSTDNTKQIITENFFADERVKYFYKENEERGAARNFGLKQAKGDYAVFFDSDDIMKTDYIETLNTIIDKHKNVFLLATQYDYFSNKGNIKKEVFSGFREGWYMRNDFLKGNFLACNYCIKIKNSSYSFFSEEKELTTMEDWLFLLSNLEQNNIYISNKLCVSMRQHDERSMMNNPKVIKARKNAARWIIENLELTDDEKKLVQSWSNYFCGVHQYLDYNRSASVKEAWFAIKAIGLNKKFLLLLIKSFIGKKIIETIR